jgi:CO/xanthine dehydrogenase Mo-binding subunit
MTRTNEMTRREFLKSFATGGAGFLVGIYLSGCGEAPTLSPTAALIPTDTDQPTEIPTETPTPRPTPNPEASFEAGIHILVDGTGKVTVVVPRTELGQGVFTSLAMVVAEEMDLPLEQVQVKHSPIDGKYGELRTGGSDSISSYFNYLSKAGSVARAMLVAAAAQLLEVPYESLRTEDGFVIHDESGEAFTYSELVETAAQIPISDVSKLAEQKDPQDYQIIGMPVGHQDCPEIVDGSTKYGLDIAVPGMLYATLLRCPVVRGSVADFDASEALAVPGVRQVFEIDSGVVVLADNTWAALQGQGALDVTWDEGEYASLSSADIHMDFEGDFQADSSLDPSRFHAIYEVPFYAHAPQEPMNCIADVGRDYCEIWAPTQNPGEAMSNIRRITGIPSENIKINIPRVGGGFGRRLQVDYVDQAVQISAQAGAPVKLMWTREEDIQQGFFHPLSVHYAFADLENLEMPIILAKTYQGWDELTYAWRSVTNFTDAFVRECFIDEMAAALGRDPYDLRLELTEGLLRQVVELAASKAAWGDPLPEGWGRGIACWSTWNVTPVAMVAEVSVTPEGSVQVQRVVCAIDCGVVVNPDMVAAQMEGGVAWGLTAALKSSIEFENGKVMQSNFDDYPLLRMDEMPEVEVYIVPSDRHPTGVGEMGVPPVAPALFNAIYNATGKRIRHLPFQPEDLL